jgi:hypothetical protein
LAADCIRHLVGSQGLGKGHNVSYNSVHDVTQPPVLFQGPAHREQQIISVLFADAQTHYSEYVGNAVFEVNACGGGVGLCAKSWAQRVEGNVFADSSIEAGISPGDYSGPVGAMTFSHNIIVNTTGFCGSGWPPSQGKFPPLPNSPVGAGLVQYSAGYAVGNGDPRAVANLPPFNDTFRHAVGAGSCYLNASTTCYTGADGVYPEYGCNFFKNCNWANHRSSYHLTDEQMNTSVVEFIDYDLSDLPIDPNVSAVLQLLGRESWQTHSVVTARDPFERRNPPWLINHTDFVANSPGAQKVQHVPLPVSQMGLGRFFDKGFDRGLVGRRQLFREGAQSEDGNSPPKFHFEDMDRVRGLTISASLGLIATAEFNMGHGAWAKFSNVVFNSASTKVKVLIRAQTNANGACGMKPHPSLLPTIMGDDATLPTPTCGQWLKNQTSLTGGHFAHFMHVANVGTCCAKCQSTPPCQLYTWSLGDGACYLNEKQGALSPCPGQCTTGGLSKSHPLPPPPVVSPVQLTFSIGAPFPVGGTAAELLGSLTLAGGAVVPSGGAESGLYGSSGRCVILSPIKAKLC